MNFTPEEHQALLKGMILHEIKVSNVPNDYQEKVFNKCLKDGSSWYIGEFLMKYAQGQREFSEL